MFTAPLIYAGLLPLIVSAAFAFMMQRMRAQPQMGWAVAVAAGFLAGQLGLKAQAGLAATWRSFSHPHEAADWLPLVVALALGVSVLLMVAARSRERRMIALATMLSIAVPLRLLSGNVRVIREWSLPEKLAYLSLLSATLGLVWLLLATEREEEPPLVRLLLLVVVAVGTAVVLTLSGVLIYGESCGALAASLSGTALARLMGASGSARRSSPKSASAVRRLSLPGLHGAAGIITFSLGSLIILGHFYASLSAANAILLFLSLAAAGGPLPDALLRRPAWLQVAARAAACLLPLAIALVHASAG